jgi:two-component system phosphate regulon response regulator PhoB
MTQDTAQSLATVLVVEDEMDMRFFLATLLKTNRYTPVLAKNGKEGLRQAVAIHPDLIIMDVMMPEEGGALMYQKLKEEATLAAIPVIVLSGVGKTVFGHYLTMLNAEGDRNIAMPDVYLEKPPESEALLAALRALTGDKGGAGSHNG